MKCVVLVGGEGTRLRPLTYTIPKQMLPIVEMAMLERVLARLSASGVDEAVLSLGYKPDAFVAAYPDGTAQGVKLDYAVEEEPLDTGGAIRFAALEAGIGDTFLAVNGDVLTDASLDDLITLHRTRSARATVALTPVGDPSAFGVVDADGEGRVRAFIEKPPPGTAPTNLINAGTYVLEPSVLDLIAPSGRTSIERVVFPALAAEGSLFAAASDAYWLDTGTPAQYLAAHRDLLSGVRGTVPHPQARPVAGTGSGTAWVIGDPELQGDVGGDSLVGDSATVLRGASVDGSTVGAGCTVAAGARITRSVLLAGSAIGEGAVVEDSIIGPGAAVGAGALVTGVSVIGAGYQVATGASLTGVRAPE